MEKILHDLGELLLKAVPTFLLVGLLYFYLKWVFFRPLERFLAARQEATEGARKLAEESLNKAAAMAAQYEAAIRAARAQIHREQEDFRQRWRQERAAALEEARQRAEALVTESGQRLEIELAEAKQALERHTEDLAAGIVHRILHRRAA